MEQVLEFLAYVNTAGWFIASIAAYKFRSIFAGSNSSWTFVMAGSIAMLARQAWQYLPGYGANFDMQIARYVIGIISGAMLIYGFYKLNKEAKAINQF